MTNGFHPPKPATTKSKQKTLPKRKKTPKPQRSPKA